MTIFVGGVHGVGKTFTTKPACAKLGLLHATASKLISEERGLATWDAEKAVSEVSENQAALIAAAKRIGNSGATLVLDGHFVLRRSPGEFERLPVDVFQALDCASILLIRAPVPVLLDRLQARGDRSWRETELRDFSKAEDEHSAYVARLLRTPLQYLDSPKMEDVENWLMTFANGTGDPRGQGNLE